MYNYTEEQAKERDIDWFCLSNNRPTHIASMGGKIPNDFLNMESLRYQQERVALIAPLHEASLNLSAIQGEVKEGYEYLEDEIVRGIVFETNSNNPGFEYLQDYSLPIRLYASTFVEMARRGFYSYARIERAEGNRYVLIAEPYNPLGGDKLSQLHLRELDCEQIDGGIEIAFR